MAPRPSTFLFTELFPDTGVQQVEELLGAHGAPPGRRATRGPGRPGRNRDSGAVLAAIRAAAASGATAAEIAVVLGVPAGVVADYLEDKGAAQ